MRYLILLFLLAGCADRPSERWFIRFSDGTLIQIDSPQYVSAGYKCASGEYKASTSVSEKVKLIGKYFGATGFEVEINNRRTPVPICEERK